MLKFIAMYNSRFDDIILCTDRDLTRLQREHNTTGKIILLLEKASE